MKKTIIGLAAVACMVNVSQSRAETPMKDLIVGAWKYDETVLTKPDGSKTYPFGHSPVGMSMFTPDGHFSQLNVADGIPKIASKNRMTATDAENKAVVQGTVAASGTYTIDEAARTITYKIDASTYPNWIGDSQPRKIIALTDKQFINENAGASAGGTSLNKYSREK